MKGRERAATIITPSKESKQGRIMKNKRLKIKVNKRNQGKGGGT